MGQTDKKLKNQLFKVAVDYIYKEHLANGQGELAKKIGISESALSRIMNDKKFVSDDTLRKMNEAFGGIFNMAYFRGEDPQCMLMEDLLYYKQHPEERLVFVKPKKENVPQSEPVQPSSQDTTLIMSKMFESMLKPIEAAHAQQVAALNQQITDKQSIIDLQADKIKSQADEIARLQKFIADLRSMPTSINIEDVLKKYPFVIGVADHPDTTRAQV
jgi:transcriptional regulator with XRE-family HTH domain